MKKLMLTLLAAGSIAAANAQSHTILLYGNATVTTDQQNYAGNITTNNIHWGINPGIGYQFSPHWTIGVQGGFDMGRNPSLVNGGTQTTVTNNWQAGLFGRYTKYFGSVFFIYGQLEGSYVGGTSEVEDITPQANYDGFNVNLFPGVGAFVARGLALNFSIGGIGYTGMNWTGNLNGLNSENKFNFTFGHQANFGISKNFGCHPAHHHMHGHHEPGDDMRHIDTSDDDDDNTPPPPPQVKEKKHKKVKKVKKVKKYDDDED